MHIIKYDSICMGGLVSMMYKENSMINPLANPMVNPMANPMTNPYYGGMQYKNMCIPQETVICNVRLARAYVPFQRLCNLYNPKEALNKGTAFPELYSPYFKTEKAKTKISPLMEKSGDIYE